MGDRIQLKRENEWGETGGDRIQQSREKEWATGYNKREKEWGEREVTGYSSHVRRGGEKLGDRIQQSREKGESDRIVT